MKNTGLKKSVKVFLYSDVSHVHDSNPGFENTVPFSKEGLKSCEIVSPEEADLFYMGQISDDKQVDLSQFVYLDKYREKHLCDIEGDWLNRQIPQELEGCKITINGAVKGIENKFQVFVRPTFSTFFINAVKRTDTFELPSYKSFCFKGLPDPHGLRIKLLQIMRESRFPCKYELTQKWNGPAPLGGDEHKSYEELMKQHIFHLCPRGCGHDSVRFFESCFFGRIPIIIGDNLLFGELEGIDLSFCYRVTQYSKDQIVKTLREAYSLGWDQIREKCQRSREFFDKYVRDYMADPTQYYLNKKEKNNAKN